MPASSDAPRLAVGADCDVKLRLATSMPIHSGAVSISCAPDVYGRVRLGLADAGWPVGSVARAGAGTFLFASVTDSDSVDLNILAVIDAREASSTYGEVVASLAVPTRGRTRGHST
jgi:hypothetical protein